MRYGYILVQNALGAYSNEKNTTTMYAIILVISRPRTRISHASRSVIAAYEPENHLVTLLMAERHLRFETDSIKAVAAGPFPQGLEDKGHFGTLCQRKGGLLIGATCSWHIRSAREVPFFGTASEGLGLRAYSKHNWVGNIMMG